MKSPQIWKTTIIVPLKKAGKPLGCISSYRPVSLTSYVAKAFYKKSSTTDTNTWRTPETGYALNKRVSVRIDHTLRLTQSISDGYQATKPRKTNRALLEYSKAFDRVWREDQLIIAI